MSVIELKISVNAANVGVVAEFLSRISNAEAKKIEVKDAEVVNPATEEPKPVAPKKAPAKKTTPKAPEPVIEEEEQEFEIEEKEEEFNAEEEEEETISLDDLKALQATKVVAHKASIVAKFKTYGAARLSDVDPKHYADYEKFLNSLK